MDQIDEFLAALREAGITQEEFLDSYNERFYPGSERRKLRRETLAALKWLTDYKVTQLINHVKYMAEQKGVKL